MIECRTTRVLLRVDENELSSLQAGFAVPETVGLLDPVWVHIRGVNQMPHVAWKKAFRALVVFECALRERQR